MTNRLHQIAQALGDEEDKRHLDPLRARVEVKTAQGGLQALQRELAEEMAYSLGRAEQRIRAVLERLKRLDGQMARACHEAPETLEALRLEFNEQRTEAERRIRDLKIQREALGFRRHGEIDRAFPVPPKKTG